KLPSAARLVVPDRNSMGAAAVANTAVPPRSMARRLRVMSGSPVSTRPETGTGPVDANRPADPVHLKSACPAGEAGGTRGGGLRLGKQDRVDDVDDAVGLVDVGNG